MICSPLGTEITIKIPVHYLISKIRDYPNKLTRLEGLFPEILLQRQLKQEEAAASRAAEQGGVSHIDRGEAEPAPPKPLKKQNSKIPAYMQAPFTKQLTRNQAINGKLLEDNAMVRVLRGAEGTEAGATVLGLRDLAAPRL